MHADCIARLERVTVSLAEVAADVEADELTPDAVAAFDHRLDEIERELWAIRRDAFPVAECRRASPV